MSNEEYKQIIIELVREVEDQQILISIYTVVKNLTKWEAGNLLPATDCRQSPGQKSGFFFYQVFHISNFFP